MNEHKIKKAMGVDGPKDKKASPHPRRINEQEKTPMYSHLSNDAKIIKRK